MAPETIVAAVAANTVWKIKNAHAKPCDWSMAAISAAWLGEPGSKKKKLEPTSPPKALAPNIKPKPHIQKMIEPNRKSTTFFITMLTAFLARVKPHSTSVKPACMKNTKKAAKQTHRTSASPASVETGSAAASSSSLARFSGVSSAGAAAGVSSVAEVSSAAGVSSAVAAGGSSS